MSLQKNVTPVIPFLALLIICILYSCASDVANRYYGATKYPPKDPKEVEMLRTVPSREHVVIADFQSRGESPKDMQKKAAAIGADAVIITILGGSYSWSDEWAGADSQSNTYTRIAGTAIKYR